jgi:hypothetical protein
MPCSRKYAPPSFREMASSYAARWSSFCAGVNGRLGVGPDLGPGLLLLMELSSRTTINDGLDMIGDFLFSPYIKRRTCSEPLASPNPDT